MLIALTDQTLPGVNTLFWSSSRRDGHEKWVDFAGKYWHKDNIVRLSEKRFVDSYNGWCRKAGYRAGDEKGREIYAHFKESVPTLPCVKETQTLVQIMVLQLSKVQETCAAMIVQMLELAQQLPEYQIVRGMYGVGDRLCPQLISEIGDITRFKKKSALTAFAGLDAPPNQSGVFNPISNRISKRGSADLRRILFEIMRVILIKKPEDNDLYTFMQKKKDEGKPYKVYIMAGANKFLRQYYGKVTEMYRLQDTTFQSESQTQ
jgi:hypothetical protein